MNTTQASGAINTTITVLKVVTLPSPFDVITKTIVSLLQLCVEAVRNRADALDLAESVSNVAASIRNLRPGPATREAQALIGLICDAQQFLDTMNVSNRKLGLKLFFSMLTQASTTRANREKLNEFKDRIVRHSTSLNLTLSVGIDNQLDVLTGQMEAVIRALGNIGAPGKDPVVRRDDYMHAINLYEALLREVEAGNIITTPSSAALFAELKTTVANVRTQFKKDSPLSTEDWMLSDADIVFEATEANEIGWGTHQVQRGQQIHFTSYQGTYFSHPVSVKLFHSSDEISFDTIPITFIERAISKDLDKWKKLSHLEFVHTLVGVSSMLSPPKVVSELCPDKIFNYVNQRPRALFRILFQLICGIESIHEAGVIHRDLNPDHILITSQGNVAISDFGMSRQTNDQVTLTFSAHPQLYSTNFHAPELLSGMRSREISTAVDVWAFGMIAYMLVSGVEPFAGQNADAVKRAVVHTKQLPPMPNLAELEDKFGAELAPLWGMIVMCLVRDRKRRISTQALQKLFRDMYKVEITYE
ncbi:hypothetical protein HDU78_004628 [Chytriomyces hyalinus]|nr:hypothetical protein HDU78_004628 [Chytriomyces hyalinus]